MCAPTFEYMSVLLSILDNTRLYVPAFDRYMGRMCACILMTEYTVAL